MTYQEIIQDNILRKKIEDIKWRDEYDDGTAIDPDEPEIEELLFSDGSWLEFDAFGKVYYHGKRK